MTSPKRQTRDYSFDKRWSPAIATHGHTSIPNLLLLHYKDLGITKPELLLIVGLEMFRWDDSKPFPSIKRLAHIIGVKKRQVRKTLESLENKHVIKRISRGHDTNLYDFEGLIYKLDRIAISTRPPGGKDPPGEEQTRRYRRSKTSSQEDAANNTPLSKPSMYTGLEKARDIMTSRSMANPDDNT